MRNLLILLTLFVYPHDSFSQQILGANVDINVSPPQLYIGIMHGDYVIDRVIQYSDTNNTHVMDFYLKGCPFTHNGVFIDTLIDIGINYPFNLQIYVYIDSMLNGCAALPILGDSLYIPASQITGIANVPIIVLNSIAVYPNPALDRIQLLFPERDLELRSLLLYDLSARLVRKFDISEDSFDISGLPRGVYFLRINTVDGEIVRKVLLE